MAYEMRISDWSSYVCASDLVIAWNFAASRVSSETLTRRTPAARSSAAYLPSWVALVVSVSSARSPVSRCRPRRRTSHRLSRRTSGPPPVRRSFRTPSRTKAPERESVVAGKSGSVRVDIGGRRLHKKNTKTSQYAGTKQRKDTNKNYNNQK